MCRFLPSYVFTIKEHPRPDANAQWWVVRVQHNGEQPGVLEHEAPSGRGLRYTSQVVAIPAMTRFVPVVQHAKRRVVGAQSAIVTGPKGEEIYPDKYGRVKVQFHWDREGKQDENTTCWIRASQGWAGSSYGTEAIPRIGQEVIVNFLEGDPDRPLITGRVYHELNRVPYELPAHKTRTVFKSMSTPGSEGEPRGFNELRIEDKKGEEEIYAHAEKDVNIHVKNDWKEHILRDAHATTDRHTYTLTKGETHETLTKASKTELHANDNLTVHADKHVVVDGKWLGKAGVEIHLKSGVKIVMEAGAELTLKAGGSWLTLSPAGISADGARVGLNSGGSAGKGTGAEPELPEGSLHYVIEGRLYATAPLKMVTDASVNKQSLTEEEAQVLFNDLKNNPDIPFQYVSDCCYARAHEMCRIMKKRGITSGKTWYYDADGGQTLMIPNPDGTRPLAGGGRWLYHVAPTVRVTGKDGKVIDKVFDPSLFDKPVSIEEWHNIMDLDSPSSARVVKNTGRDIFYIGPHSDRAIYDEDMKETKQAFNQHQDALKAGVI